MKLKIGIIGYGYVGRAVAASYPNAEILVYDPKYTNDPQFTPFGTIHSVCDAVFVCVPTPQSDTGECDTSILNQTLINLKGSAAVVICKSTAPPDFYTAWENKDCMRLAHVPEFLTQARASLDYVNPHKILVGCQETLQSTVADILMASMINFERVRIEYCSIAEASFFKYMANSMLAMKVIINNELADLAERIGISWEAVSLIAKTDSRLGSSHWRVPGDNGELGYGGACFPKDTAALKNLADQNGAELSVLEAVMFKNHKLRTKNGSR